MADEDRLHSRTKEESKALIATFLAHLKDSGAVRFGSATITTDNVSETVSLTPAYLDANYAVIVSAEGGHVSPLYVSAKSASEFTISFAEKPSANATVNWMTLKFAG